MPVEIVVALIGLIGVVITTALGGIGWLIKKAIDSNKELNKVQAQATQANTDAIIAQVGELTEVVQVMTTENAVVAKTLEMQNEKLIENSTSIALLFRKTDTVESKVDTLKGKCEARHE